MACTGASSMDVAAGSSSAAQVPLLPLAPVRSPVPEPWFMPSDPDSGLESKRSWLEGRADDNISTASCSSRDSSADVTADLGGRALPRVPINQVIKPSFLPKVNISRHNVLSATDAGAIADLRELLSEGVDVDMSDSDGRTALMSSCENSNEEILRVLLASGADLGKEDEEGSTALHKAAKVRPTASRPGRQRMAQ